MGKIETEELHRIFLDAVDQHTVDHSKIDGKPLEVDCRHPLPPHIRLYIYNATNPPGGRGPGEYKVQLIVPGQSRGEHGSFDTSNGRIPILMGYAADVEIFIIWDAGRYPEFGYSRNVQVKAETIFTAVGGRIGTQKRHLRSTGTETVLTADRKRLPEALRRRFKLNLQRLTDNGED